MENLKNSAETYGLGRDFLASARLNFQHYLWKESCGFNLHPAIPREHNELMIAEVGTGTGIWLLELAKDLPASAKLDGFDISDSQFPAREWIPANVSFQKLDASVSPPASLQGQYDIVHIRLFTLVVDNNDPSSIIKHCMSLLKPGGYIQWDEYNSETTGVIRANDSIPMEGLASMLAGMGAQKPLNWIPKLTSHFLTNGLLTRASVEYAPPDYLLRPFTEMLCVAHMEHASLLEENGQIEGGKRVRALIEKVVAEAKQGAYFRHALQVVVARKPVRGNVYWSQL